MRQSTLQQKLLPLLLAAFTVASPLPPTASLSARAPAYIFAGDAPYSVGVDLLQGAITCPLGQPHAGSHTVLLIHGTGSTGAESWGAGYVPALASDGFTPCYIDLPSRAMNDMQVSSEYVAYAIHYLSEKSGGSKISAVSHSQGGPDMQWALRFWPSTRSRVKSFVALSPDFLGVNSQSFLYQFCTNKLTNGLMLYLCSQALWQQAIGSNYFKALNQDKRAFVPTTAVYTVTDGTVLPPAANAQLPGAAVNMAIQSICPGSTTPHNGMIVDPVAYQFALNALTTDGTADMATVRKVMPKDTCSASAAPGMDANLVTDLGSALSDIALGILLGGDKTGGEPPLKSYAQLASQ